MNATTQTPGPTDKHVNAAAENAQVAANSGTTPEYKVYKSSVASIGYIFKNGKKASFVNGKYATNIKHEIAELEAEVDAGHPTITRGTAEEAKEVKVETMEGLRARIIAEYEEQQKRALNPANKVGSSDIPKLTPQNSQDLKLAAADSTGDASTGAPANQGAAGTVKINLPKA